MQISVITYS